MYVNTKYQNKTKLNHLPHVSTKLQLKVMVSTGRIKTLHTYNPPNVPSKYQLPPPNTSEI